MSILVYCTIIGGVAGLIELADRFVFKRNLFKRFFSFFSKSIKLVINYFRYLFLRDTDLLILGLISSREIGYKHILYAGKRIHNSPAAPEIVMRSLTKLKKSGLIERSAQIGGVQDLQNQLFKTTDSGKKKSMRITYKYSSLLKALRDDINLVTGPLVSKVTEPTPKIENRNTEILDNLIFILTYKDGLNLPCDRDKIKVEAYCRDCMVQLETEHGPTGIYSPIEGYSCPCCNIEIDSEIFEHDKARALSNTIKKILGIPLGTIHDERF